MCIRILSLIFALSFVACGVEESDSPIVNPPVENTFKVTVDTSECGGFLLTEAKLNSPEEESRNYCDAEMLHISFDADSKKIVLSNERVLLNCCGIHSVEVEQVDGVFVIHEKDRDESIGRCDCLCVFDFRAEIESDSFSASSEVPVKIVREVTDNGKTESSVVWEGNIDLSKGDESIEINSDDVGGWCIPEEHEKMTYSFKASACGGFAKEENLSEPEGETEETPYCDAEALRVSYDNTKKELVISDDRVLLNCCGDHRSTVSLENGVYVIRQKDAPEQDGARCYCMCVFDFKSTIVNPNFDSSKIIDVMILREVTDENSGEEKEIWSGQIDLSKSSQEIIVDNKSVDPWCQ